MDGLPKVYRQEKLTFIVTPSKTIVQTHLSQNFLLEPKFHYWRKRLRLINNMIQLGEIRDLNELSEWCGNGVQWTSLNYKIETGEDRAD